MQIFDWFICLVAATKHFEQNEKSKNRNVVLLHHVRAIWGYFILRGQQKKTVSK